MNTVNLLSIPDINSITKIRRKSRRRIIRKKSKSRRKRSKSRRKSRRKRSNSRRKRSNSRRKSRRKRSNSRRKSRLKSRRKRSKTRHKELTCDKKSGFCKIKSILKKRNKPKSTKRFKINNRIKYIELKEEDPTILIYTLKGCGPCIRAKEELIKNKVKFIEKDITEYREEVSEMSDGYKYAPAVFTYPDKKFIGGNPELHEYIKKTYYINDDKSR